MMPQITIIQQTPFLKGILKRRSFKKRTTYECLILGEVSDDILQFLKEKNIKIVEPFSEKGPLQEQFLNAANDAVGYLNAHHDERLWGALDLSSKNRFTTNLTRHFEDFLSVMSVIKKEDYDELLVVNVSWVILPSIRLALKARHTGCVCIENHFQKWLEILWVSAKKICSSGYHIGKIYYRAWLSRKELRRVLRSKLQKKKPCDVIKTFIYDASFVMDGEPAYADAFFGPLVEFLKEKKDIIIFANILGNFPLSLKHIRRLSLVIVPFEYFLSWKDIICEALAAYFYRPSVKLKVPFFEYDARAIIHNELLSTGYKIQLYQLMHYRATQKLAKNVSIKNFIMTYENNPWEKMCLMALKENSPATKVIGYQHTVVPQASLNMFPSIYEKNLPRPDRILTVGEAPKNIMEKYGTYEENVIQSSCGLRFQYLFSEDAPQRKRTNRILVALEGIFDVYKLVNYVVQELKDDGRYQVTIRTHPVLPLKQFRHKLNHDPSGIAHFRISEAGAGAPLLKDDLKNNDIVIYWGSTVALEALNSGKPIIHFDTGSLLSFDPLFECPHLKWVVTKNDALSTVIEKIYSLPDEEYDRQLARAKTYLSNYFHPVSPENLQKFIGE